MTNSVQVTVTFEQYAEDFPPVNLLAFQAWLQERIDEVPQEYRGGATIEIESTLDYDNNYATIDISYFLLQTKQETEAIAKRDADQKKSERARILAALAKLDGETL